QQGIPSTQVHWPYTGQEPSAVTRIRQKKIDMVINIPKNYEEQELTNDYLIRRAAVDFNVSLMTNAQLARLFIDAFIENRKLEIKGWDEY
ncbi:MAG TPA: hypothetical protein VJH88_05520, partial [Candidatus Nanoarchaeia archaeon]|nr:hypothetical protein [Candidatus Nanoarchaeia archaeon]